MTGRNVVSTKSCQLTNSRFTGCLISSSALDLQFGTILGVHYFPAYRR
jgi:hypothetical protein